MCGSEIVQLRRQIESEMDAMQRAMQGFALGTARHDFIQARMERIGACQDTLAHHIGPTAAGQIVCKLYMQVMEEPSQQVDR